MQRLQRSLIRIIKGPAGGFLASLGVAAVLGGVALASPAPPIASVPDHRPDVVTADPFGSYATSNGGDASGVSTPSGGVLTVADPTGRGPALDPPSNGHRSEVPASADGSSGGLRSAGASPAHQDARDDPPTSHGSYHGQQHHGATGHRGAGHQGSSSGHSPSGPEGDKGSGSGGPAGSGSNGSGARGDSGGSTGGSSGNAGTGSSGNGGSGRTGNSSNGHATR